MSDLTEAMRRNYTDLVTEYGITAKTLLAAANILDSIDRVVSNPAADPLGKVYAIQRILYPEESW